MRRRRRRRRRGKHVTKKLPKTHGVITERTIRKQSFISTVRSIVYLTGNITIDNEI